MPTPAKWPAVAAAIRRRIFTGEYEPGERLPAEYRLAREFDVSVPVVRTAMGVLRNEGLVRTMHGTGTFVRLAADRGDVNLQGPLTLTYEVSRFLSSAGELRRWVRIRVAGMSVYEVEHHDFDVSDEEVVKAAVQAFTHRLRLVLAD
jgi:DNA-binding FadR family transcriptional regulator